MNVPCSGFGQKAGLVATTVVMAMAGLVPYLVFRHRDWL